MRFNDQGDKLAFLYAADATKANTTTGLWLSENQGKAVELVSAGHAALPEGWVVSQYGSLYFSKSSSRLFFTTSPQPRQRDTTVLAENRPNVQVWSWNEPVEYTVQQYNKQSDLMKSYQAVYLLEVK